jgi:hypothetical protein
MTSAPESAASSTAPPASGITHNQTPAQRMIGDFAPKLAERGLAARHVRDLPGTVLFDDDADLQ